MNALMLLPSKSQQGAMSVKCCTLVRIGPATISYMLLLAYVLADCPASADPAWSGRYLMEAEVKIDARRVYRRNFHTKLDIVVGAANEAGQHKFLITTEGHTCVLTGTPSAAQPAKILFAAGQTCDQQVSEPDFKASLHTKLDRGDAEFLNGHMTLRTRWIVGGEVTLTTNPETPTIVDAATLISRGTGARQP